MGNETSNTNQTSNDEIKKEINNGDINACIILSETQKKDITIKKNETMKSLELKCLKIFGLGIESITKPTKV